MSLKFLMNKSTLSAFAQATGEKGLYSVFMFSLFNQLKPVFSCSICVSEFRGTELTELILK